MSNLNECISCHADTFYVAHGYALRPGHIYSEAGLREFRITRFCEYCFDSVTSFPEDVSEEDDTEIDEFISELWKDS